MTNRKVAVIGGAGFLSREIVSQLLERGDEVFVGDVDSSVSRGELPYHLSDRERERKTRQLSFGRIDILDERTFENIPKGFDTVIQTAGYFNFWPIDKERARRINVDGTRNLVEHCLDNGVKDYLYYSSIEAVGSASDRESLPGAREKDSPHERELKRSLYKRTKTEAHELVGSYCERFNDKGKRLMMRAPSTPIGKGMEKVPTGELITNTGRLIRLCAPNSFLSCIDTRDLARDDLLALERGKNGETYVSVGFHSKIHDILKAREKLTGVIAPRFEMPKWSLIPIATCMEAIGRVNRSYRPEMTVEQAVRTKENHFYDTSFTRRRLGLTEEDYHQLENSVENTVRYMKDRRILN